MKRLKLMAVCAILTASLVTGCGDSSGSALTADGNDIAAYVAEHPNSDAGTEVEGGDL